MKIPDWFPLGRKGEKESGRKEPDRPRKTGSPYRAADVPLKIAGLTRIDLVHVIRGFIESGALSVDEVNERVSTLQRNMGQKVNNVTRPDRLLTLEQSEKLLIKVKARFKKHNKDSKFKEARKGIEWESVQVKLEENPEKMWSLNEMERTGGEPDVVGYDDETDEYIFMDCAKESPSGRRNICFNRFGQEEAEKRREKPAGNAAQIAEAMGIKITTKKEYEKLKTLGEFDKNTWSWVMPDTMGDDEISTAGVALVGSRYDGGVRVYENGVNHRSASRAFRGSLRV